MLFRSAGSRRFVGDAADEEHAVDVTAQQLACGGETDEGEEVAARHDLEQEIPRKRPAGYPSLRRATSYYLSSAFSA